MNERRKQGILLFFPVMVLLLGIIFTTALFYHNCRQIAYQHISTFCEVIPENSPDAEPQLLSGLKEYQSLTEQEIAGNDYLGKYGYRAEEFCQGLPTHLFILPVILFLMVSGAYILTAWLFHRHNRKRIVGLTEYLERINLGSTGTLIQTQEDDFSGLQDEIYKTVTTLYQTRESAVSARNNFADNLANIAHQLKTPITAASLSLQLMKEKAASECAGQIEKQLERLISLEESLLMLSRIDTGTLLLKHEKVDLYTALNLAAENLSGLLRNKHISIEIPDNGCMEFSGDLEWTMEAFINLMKNCMEHSQPGGIIHCDYSCNPLYSKIRIWDDGAGFDPEDLPHLFDRFYRGRHAAGNGIGIGLALARSIFELQNGTISAYNCRNSGACFEVRLYSH